MLFPTTRPTAPACSGLPVCVQADPDILLVHMPGVFLSPRDRITQYQLLSTFVADGGLFGLLRKYCEPVLFETLLKDWPGGKVAMARPRCLLMVTVDSSFCGQYQVVIEA